MIENPITRVWHDYDRKNINVLRKDGITRSYPATWHNSARTWQAVQSAIKADDIRGVFARGTYFSRMYQAFNPPQTWKFEYVTLKILPSLDLQITLTDAGLELVKDLTEQGKGFYRIQGELLEEALGNGWTLDPNNTDDTTITLDPYDGSGEIDYDPGSLCWSDPMYAIRFWYDNRVTVFHPYYLGDWSTDQQGYLSRYQ